MAASLVALVPLRVRHDLPPRPEPLFHWVIGEAVTRTAIRAYMIAIMGLAMIVAGAGGLFILFTAEMPRVPFELLRNGDRNGIWRLVLRTVCV
jgi:hypothetical protein